MGADWRRRGYAGQAIGFSPRVRSRPTAALLIAALALAGHSHARAAQVPQRFEKEDAKCDPSQGIHLTPRLLGVVVNDTDVERESIFLQRPCGAVLARTADLEAVRIKTAGKPTVEVNGEPYVNLNAFPGLTFVLDEEQQRISIDGEPQIFYPTVLNFEKDLATRTEVPPFGGFLNYGVFSSGTKGADPSYSLTAGLGVFGEPGVLTSDWLHTRGEGVNLTYRIATTFTHDDEKRIATLRVGDVFARAGAFGGGGPLGGIQYGSNFALRPGMITSPVQMMEASTRRNATVDLQSYDPGDPDRNARAAFFNALTTAPYGPVELANVPTYDNGEYEMVLRDRYGRETRVTQEFYFNQGLLRQGLSDYSVEAGVLRQGAVGDHYAGGFASGTLRRGETARFTDEVHAEASSHGAAAGATGLWSLPGIGVVALTAAGSKHELGDGLGAFAAVGLENRYRRYAYAGRAECRTADFFLASETSGTNPLACREFASFSGRLPWRDNASVSVSNSSNRVGPDNQALLLSYSTSLVQGSQLQLTTGWNRSAGRTTFAAGLTFTLAFGPARVPVPYFEPSRTNLSVIASHNSDSANTAFARVATGAGSSDNAYGVQAGLALDGRDVAQLSGSWSGSRAVAVASANHDGEGEGSDTFSLGASSALAFLDGGVFASRPLFSSFALVRLGEENKGMRVNDFRTNSDGDLVVTPLQPYYENLVSLNPADLPVNARVEKLQYQVRPRFRSGIVLKPSIEQARDALFTVQLDDGNGARVPLPLGAYATVEGVAEPFPVGEEGLMYVAGVGAGGEVRIHHKQQECVVRLKLPKHPAANTTPELGTVLCEGVRP